MEDIKVLRTATGAGIMDCKKALTESGGDVDKATSCLKEKGYLKVQSKSDRIANEGLIEPYVHVGSRLGVLVEVNCETDFVAKTDDFRTFAHDIAMHIAAANPKYVSIDEVPSEVLDEIPEEERDTFIKNNCLFEQPFIKDESVTIGNLLTDLISKIGENIRVRRFVRYRLGQGDED